MASTPGAPPAVRYPPLFPAALSVVWRLAPRFPDNLPLLKGVCLVAALGLILALPGALRAAGFSPAVSAATALLTAAAPLTMRYATAIASELPFALLALGALWLVERSTRIDGGPGTAVLAGTLAGLAFLTRSLGVAVVGAGIVTLLRRGARGRALAFALAAAPHLAGWAAWLVVQRGQGGSPGYVAALLHDGVPGPVIVLEHLIALPAAVAIVTFPGLSDLLPQAPSWPILLAVYGSGLVALTAALWRAFGAYVAITLAIAVTTPWFQPRFLVPLAPFFLAALLATVSPPRAGRSRRAAGAVLVVALLGCGLAGSRLQLRSSRASGLPALEEGASGAQRWTEVEQTVAWLRAHTGPQDVLASFHDPLLYLYTDRRVVQAYPALWSPDPAQVTTALAGSGARYLIDIPCADTDVWAGSRAAWRAWLTTHAGSLTPAYQTPSGRLRVWRLTSRGY